MQLMVEISIHLEMVTVSDKSRHSESFPFAVVFFCKCSHVRAYCKKGQNLSKNCKLLQMFVAPPLYHLGKTVFGELPLCTASEC